MRGQNSKTGMTINIFTIGFAKKSAREFFTKLKEAGAKSVIDVRLNNTSQLAGFTKKQGVRRRLGRVNEQICGNCGFGNFWATNGHRGGGQRRCGLKLNRICIGGQK